jgi:hypothetical protein
MDFEMTLSRLPVQSRLLRTAFTRAEVVISVASRENAEIK